MVVGIKRLSMILFRMFRYNKISFCLAFALTFLFLSFPFVAYADTPTELSVSATEQATELAIEIEIIDQPHDLVGVSGGDTVSLSVNATNVKSYEWFYYDYDSNKWVSASSWTGGTTDTLTFVVNQYRLNFSYKCVLTDYQNNTVETNTVHISQITIVNEDDDTSQTVDLQTIHYDLCLIVFLIAVILGFKIVHTFRVWGYQQ